MLLQDCGDSWSLPHAANSNGKAKDELRNKKPKHDGAWNRTGAHGPVCWPYWQRRRINSAYRSETELPPPRLTYSHPRHLRAPRAWPPFPYPHGKDHQLTLSSPVSTADSYANGAGEFHRDVFSVAALCAYGGPAQTYFHDGTSPALTRSNGNFGFS